MQNQTYFSPPNNRTTPPLSLYQTSKETMNRDSTAMFDPFLSNMMRRLSEIEPIQNNLYSRCQTKNANRGNTSSPSPSRALQQHRPSQQQHPPMSPSSASRGTSSPVESYFSESEWAQKPPSSSSFDSMTCLSKQLHYQQQQPLMMGQSQQLRQYPHPQNQSPNQQQHQQQSPQQQKLSPYSVFVGRGNAAKNAVGNRRLTILAKTKLAEYAKADTKNKKSAIVSSLLNTVRGAGGSFVKVVNGKILETNDHAAREKIGALLRDMLGEKYRSSSKAKVMKRQKLRKEKRNDSSNQLNEQGQVQHAQQQARHQQHHTRNEAIQVPLPSMRLEQEDPTITSISGQQQQQQQPQEPQALTRLINDTNDVITTAAALLESRPMGTNIMNQYSNVGMFNQNNDNDVDDVGDDDDTISSSIDGDILDSDHNGIIPI